MSIAPVGELDKRHLFVEAGVALLRHLGIEANSRDLGPETSAFLHEAFERAQQDNPKAALHLAQSLIKSGAYSLLGERDSSGPQSEVALLATAVIAYLVTGRWGDAATFDESVSPADRSPMVHASIGSDRSYGKALVWVFAQATPVGVSTSFSTRWSEPPIQVRERLSHWLHE